MLCRYICFSRESVNDKKNKIDDEFDIIVDISGYYDCLRIYIASIFPVFLRVGSQWFGVVHNSVFGIYFSCGMRCRSRSTIGTVETIGEKRYAGSK